MCKPLIYLICTCVLLSCDSKKEEADIIVTNANIYTVNEANPKAQSFAIKEGRFLMVGSSKDIKDHYRSKEVIDLGGKTVVPETEIPNMVTFALFADPEGNVVGLVKSEQ